MRQELYLILLDKTKHALHKNFSKVYHKTMITLFIWINIRFRKTYQKHLITRHLNVCKGKVLEKNKSQFCIFHFSRENKSVAVSKQIKCSLTRNLIRHSRNNVVAHYNTKNVLIRFFKPVFTDNTSGRRECKAAN